MVCKTHSVFRMSYVNVKTVSFVFTVPPLLYFYVLAPILATNKEKQHSLIFVFRGNIPGNKIEEGETVMNYLRAFPIRGTGYHRHIFVLYKQEKKLIFQI